MSTQRVAIVTGAARGIGAATAERLGRDGFAVGVLDLDEAACEMVAARIRDAGGRAVGVGVDVTDAGQVEAGVARVAGELGPPVVLVNNAGIIRDNLIFKMTEVDWDAVMNVHLKGAFLMTKACQAHMTAEKHGRIVNLSSSSAQGNRGQANYSAAKAGLQGFIQTDMTRATAERIGVPFDDFIAHSAQQIPVARVGQPEDIAGTIAFLVSEEAGFVSGQVIYVA